MTKPDMIFHIKKRLKEEHGLDVNTRIIRCVMNIEQDEIMQCIALEDTYDYVWGTIGGEQKAPKRLAGKMADTDQAIANHGFSWWKLGVPFVKFSNKALKCERRPPEDYFELEENRYTSLARKFRQLAHFPEIPEYDGLSEEKIQQLCGIADQIEISHLTRSELADRERDIKYNGMKNYALHRYWEQINYKPYGCISDDYTGPQMDNVDFYMNTHYYGKEDRLNLQDQLEIILLAEYIKQRRALPEDSHPELKELEQKIRDKMAEEGIEPYPPKTFDPNKTTEQLSGDYLRKLISDQTKQNIQSTREIRELKKWRSYDKFRQQFNNKEEIADKVDKYLEDLAKAKEEHAKKEKERKKRTQW